MGILKRSRERVEVTTKLYVERVSTGKVRFGSLLHPIFRESLTTTHTTPSQRHPTCSPLGVSMRTVATRREQGVFFMDCFVPLHHHA